MKNNRENTPGETKVKLAPGFSKNISFSYSSFNAVKFKWSIRNISPLEPHAPRSLPRFWQSGADF